jgi:hypothetical protein
MVDGTAVVVDAARAAQLRALGNAVVPLQAAVAVRELLRRSGVKINREHLVVEEIPIG